MPTTTVRWLGEDGTPQSGDCDALDAACRAGSWVWIDVFAPDQEVMGALERRFELHPLAIEDSLHTQRRAKVDIYAGSLFLVWLTPWKQAEDGIETHALSFFIGSNYLITTHAEGDAAIDAVGRDAARALKGGPDWTLHAIIDYLVDSALPMVDDLGEQLEAVEEQMLEAPRQQDLLTLHRIRRQLLQLHRIVAPERDVIRGVGRERDVVSEDAYRYFQDVGDHLARLQDSIETYQDVGASVMDVYLSAQNNRMNEIMKQLTVVATIFMPLTLLSGIYGMNLIRGMWPAPDQVWSFALVVGSMVIIAVAMAGYFRKKNWW